MRWGIFGKPSVQYVYREMVEVVEQLKKRKQDVILETRFADHLKTKGRDIEDIDADILVTVGGDGTILAALQHWDKPILAVNAGGVGFLSEVEPKYVASAIDRVLRKDYRIEERERISATLDDQQLPDAANEVTVQSAKIAKLVKVQIAVDGDIMDTLRADGIIVATSTGSTGYSLSVGGPILHPEVQALVISPIAPFRLGARPVVIPSSSEVTLTLLEGMRGKIEKEGRVVIDGQHGYAMTVGSVVTVRPSKLRSRFIRFNGGFYERVRTKLAR